jgi:hypothetical protein
MEGTDPMLPLYGFMEGDTLGVLVLADETDSVESLAGKLRDASSLRVNPIGDGEVIYRGAVLDPSATLAEAGVKPLQRFDLRRKHGISESRDA